MGSAAGGENVRILMFTRETQRNHKIQDLVRKHKNLFFQSELATNSVTIKYYTICRDYISIK